MRIVFLCFANSVRSQLAEGIARVLLPEHEIASAGVSNGSLHPLVPPLLAEISCGSEGLCSKHYNDVALNSADLIVSCAAGLPVTIPSNARFLEWALPDPGSAGGGRDAQLIFYRGIRDQLIQRILALREEL